MHIHVEKQELREFLWGDSFLGQVFLQIFHYLQENGLEAHDVVVTKLHKVPPYYLQKIEVHP